MMIDGTQMMQQTQTQMQTRKMDGTGGGQGKGQGGDSGLKDVMQNLSVEDRATLQEQLQTMSSEDKKIAKEQLKSVDATNLSSEDYLSSLLATMGQTKDVTTNEDGFITEIYA